MDKKPKVCFDCINCEQCPTGLACSANPACTMFKDKSRFVELPCKVGDVIYCFAPCFDADHRPRLKVIEREIIRLRTTLTVSGLISDINNIGKTVFLTREEAEKALKDMRKASNGGKIND